MFQIISTQIPLQTLFTFITLQVLRCEQERCGETHIHTHRCVQHKRYSIYIMYAEQNTLWQNNQNNIFNILSKQF